jgi:hypothetical protein
MVFLKKLPKIGVLATDVRYHDLVWWLQNKPDICLPRQGEAALSLTSGMYDLR